MNNEINFLYYSSVIFNSYQDNFWNDLYSKSRQDGKFFIDLGRKMNPARFVPRNGNWSLPWDQRVPLGFEMPKYDPLFKKDFSEITDQRAIDIKNLINQYDNKFAIMYSGGIDSTLVVCSLIKNLNKTELKNISICTSTHAIIENPRFFSIYIKDKFEILDSSKLKYDDLIEKGYRPITADEGDCIFGTLFGIDFYRNYDFLISKVSSNIRHKLQHIKNPISSDTHYSNYKDLLIEYFSLPHNRNFGKRYYEKIDENIKSSGVPVTSLHDFFWWLIFNLKYVNCGIRGAVFYNDRLNCRSVIYDHIINWFTTVDYQQWSMVNNNNGKKIQDTVSSYKIESKKYIFEFDQNEWYFKYKIKLESLGHIVAFQDLKNISIDQRPNARFGLDQNFKVLYIDDQETQEFIRNHVIEYQEQSSNQIRS